MSVWLSTVIHTVPIIVGNRYRYTLQPLKV